jgi:hypothetical protein
LHPHSSSSVLARLISPVCDITEDIFSIDAL